MSDTIPEPAGSIAHAQAAIDRVLADCSKLARAAHAEGRIADEQALKELRQTATADRMGLEDLTAAELGAVTARYQASHRELTEP